jgi:Tub family
MPSQVLQSMSSHYVFSLKAGDLFRKRDQRSRLFLGKLRSTSSSEYILYDNGMVRSTSDRDSEYQTNVDDEDEEDDERDNKGDTKDEVSLFRKELAVIYFNTKKRPAPLGVRGSEICIPTRRHGGESTQDRKAEAKDSSSSHAGQSLQNPFQIIRNESKQNQLYAKKCYIMHERTSRYGCLTSSKFLSITSSLRADRERCITTLPSVINHCLSFSLCHRYDPLSSCLVDFKGRANMASVKNFQLVESYVPDSDAKKSQEIDSEREYILQVGKVRHFVDLSLSFEASLVCYVLKALFLTN